MKLIVDRIEGKFAICQNLKTKTLFEEEVNKIPFLISEGDIIIRKHEKYFKDEAEKEKRLKKLEAKFRKLKK